MLDKKHYSLLIVISTVSAFCLTCQTYIREGSIWRTLQETTREDYRIDVTRVVSNSSDSLFITRAEGCCPEEKRRRQNQDVKTDSSRSWWYDKHLDVKIPWAITDEAVKFYVEYVTNCMHPHLLFSGNSPPLSAMFTYKAQAEHYNDYTQLLWVTNKNDTLVENTETIYYRYNPQDTARWCKIADEYHNVTVVRMILDFGCQWTPMAGVGFTKIRVVVFNENGEILKVYGDGKTPIWVS